MDSYFGGPVIAKNASHTQPSWLTTVRPDYYFARSETQFSTKHMKEFLYDTYIGHNQPSLRTMTFEYPSQLAFPHIYSPPPAFVNPEKARMTPRSGNVMRVVDTYDPQEETATESLQSRQTETFRYGMDQLELIKRNRYEQAQRQQAIQNRATDYTKSKNMPELNSGVKTE